MGRETFHRPDTILTSEIRSLPAKFYNLAHVTVAQSADGYVFVPIRSMQYLAILDREEFIFIDGVGSRIIVIAWRNFKPNERNTLDEPVPYQAVYYERGALLMGKRLQGDFSRALSDYVAKYAPVTQTATVLRFCRHENT